MKKIVLLLSFCIILSCETQDNLAVPKNLETNNFVWKGMNLYYLWQADVANLADSNLPIKTN